MIWQRIRVDVWHRKLKGDHFLVNQVLDLVLEIDTVFCIMSNTVGMISTSLLRFVEFGVEIHGLGPHRVDYPATDNLLNSLVLFSASAVMFLEGFFSNLGR